MQGLRKLADRLADAAGLLLGFLLLLQIVVVAFRYVFAIGRPWATDLLTYVYCVAILLPGILVLVANLSVRVDVFYAQWGPRRRALVDRIALLVLFVPAMGYATYASWAPTLSSWHTLEGSPTYGGLPGFFLLKTGLTLFLGSLALTGLVLGLRRSPYHDLESR